MGNSPGMECGCLSCFAAGLLEGEPVAEHDHRSRRGEELDARPPGDAPGVPGQVIDLAAVRSEDRCVKGLAAVQAGNDAELIGEPAWDKKQQGCDDEADAQSFFRFWLQCCLCKSGVARVAFRMQARSFSGGGPKCFTLGFGHLPEFSHGAASRSSGSKLRSQRKAEKTNGAGTDVFPAYFRVICFSSLNAFFEHSGHSPWLNSASECSLI